MAHTHGLGVIKFCRQGGRQGIQEEGLDNSFYPKFIDIGPLSSFQPDTEPTPMPALPPLLAQPLTLDSFSRPSEQRRSVSPVNMVPVTVPPSGRPSRRWKLPSTPDTLALTVARSPSSEPTLVSGLARAATSLMLVVPTPSVPLLPLPSDLPLGD